MSSPMPSTVAQPALNADSNKTPTNAKYDFGLASFIRLPLNGSNTSGFAWIVPVSVEQARRAVGVERGCIFWKARQEAQRHALPLRSPRELQRSVELDRGEYLDGIALESGLVGELVEVLEAERHLALRQCDDRRNAE